MDTMDTHMIPPSIEDTESDGVKCRFTAGQIGGAKWMFEDIGWQFVIVFLPAMESISLSSTNTNAEPHVLIKIIHGTAVVIDQDCRRRIQCVADPFSVRSCYYELNERIVIEAESDTFLLYGRFAAGKQDLQVHSVESLVVKGPYSHALRWKKVEELSWGSAFAGVDFYNLRGWELSVLSPNSDNGSSMKLKRLFVQAWAASPSVNCGDHDHSENIGDDAFGEVHLTLLNGTGAGGMVFYDDDKKEVRMPLAGGQEHGPFWEMKDQKPVLRADGSLIYPLHRWQTGDGSGSGMDVWFAFELHPDLLL